MVLCSRRIHIPQRLLSVLPPLPPFWHFDAQWRVLSHGNLTFNESKKLNGRDVNFLSKKSSPSPRPSNRGDLHYLIVSRPHLTLHHLSGATQYNPAPSPYTPICAPRPLCFPFLFIIHLPLFPSVKCVWSLGGFRSVVCISTCPRCASYVVERFL